MEKHRLWRCWHHFHMSCRCIDKIWQAWDTTNTLGCRPTKLQGTHIVGPDLSRPANLHAILWISCGMNQRTTRHVCAVTHETYLMGAVTPSLLMRLDWRLTFLNVELLLCKQVEIILHSSPAINSSSWCDEFIITKVQKLQSWLIVKAFYKKLIPSSLVLLRWRWRSIVVGLGIYRYAEKACHPLMVIGSSRRDNFFNV